MGATEIWATCCFIERKNKWKQDAIVFLVKINILTWWWKARNIALLQKQFLEKNSVTNVYGINLCAMYLVITEKLKFSFFLLTHYTKYLKTKFNGCCFMHSKYFKNKLYILKKQNYIENIKKTF